MATDSIRTIPREPHGADPARDAEEVRGILGQEAAGGSALTTVEKFERHHVLDPDARPFGNYFGWSYSAGKTFRECPRRWWFSKVLFWRGWEASASRDARLAYRLTKMSSIPQTCGIEIHSAAGWRYRAPVMANLDAAMNLLRSAVRKAVVYAQEERWRQNPKHLPPLSEYYYQGGSDPASKGPEWIERAEGCLENLFGEPLDGAETLLIDPDAPPLLVDLDGVPIWTQIDLAWSEAGTVRIRDYKTGARRKDDTEQAAFLIVLADRIWQKPVVVELDYLVDGESVTGGPVERSEIDAGADELRERAAAVRSLLKDPDKNVADPEAFPPSHDVETCRWCDFLHLCQGTRDRQEADLSRIREAGELS